MPANDPKAKLCAPFSIIELFDGDERVDLFRILPSSHSSDESAEIITFDCEHVLATLSESGGDSTRSTDSKLNGVTSTMETTDSDWGLTSNKTTSYEYTGLGDVSYTNDHNHSVVNDTHCHNLRQHHHDINLDNFTHQHSVSIPSHTFVQSRGGGDY